MMKRSIADFHTSFYIPEMQDLAFKLPHLRILGTNHCGNTRREAFKLCTAKQDVFFCRDYSERVVFSFAHQLQSECYCINISVYIEDIALDHFSASHVMLWFHYYFSDDSKDDSSTTTAHSKRILELLNKITLCQMS